MRGEPQREPLFLNQAQDVPAAEGGERREKSHLFPELSSASGRDARVAV